MASSGAVDALGQALGKVLDLFTVFDLSFILSGAALLASGIYLWTGLGGTPPQMDTLGIVSGIISAYLLGLVAFAIGRPVRKAAVGPWYKPAVEKNRPSKTRRRFFKRARFDVRKRTARRGDAAAA